MKTLYKKEKFNYCSEVVEHKGKKYKIVAENGNCYSRVCVYVFTKNEDLGLIASEFDINDIRVVDYLDNDEKRLRDSQWNILCAKEYIKLIY